MGQEIIRDPREAFSRLVLAISAAGARSLEFGFYPDGDPDREPEPDEEVTWWAVARFRGGIVQHELRSADPRLGALEAVAGLVRQLGGQVEIRYQ